MTIEEALVTTLKANENLYALIGGRIYPLLMPHNPTYPLIVYQKISGSHIYSHSGASHLASPRFQFSCWGTSYASAKDVANKLRLALEGYKGTVDGVAIQGAFIANDIDDFDADGNVFRVILDFMLWHSE